MFNIITSVGRLQNVSLIKNHIQPFNIKWHVITDEDLGFSLQFKDPWISTYVCPNHHKEFWARCHGALNWFIETQFIEDEEFYCFMNDDDGYESNFFNKLSNVLDQVKNHNPPIDIIIVSMKRGNNISRDAVAVRQHPTSTLIANPNNMKVGYVGLEQIIIKGEILKKYRLPMEACGDGMFIEKIVSENRIVYEPEIYVYFNYFEPGRWNKCWRQNDYTLPGS